jgi:hypothetical protein
MKQKMSVRNFPLFITFVNKVFEIKIAVTMQSKMASIMLEYVRKWKQKYDFFGVKQFISYILHKT